jgi:hypothetical protein
MNQSLVAIYLYRIKDVINEQMFLTDNKKTNDQLLESLVLLDKSIDQLYSRHLESKHKQLYKLIIQDGEQDLKILE